MNENIDSDLSFPEGGENKENKEILKSLKSRIALAVGNFDRIKHGESPEPMYYLNQIFDLVGDTPGTIPYSLLSEEDRNFVEELAEVIVGFKISKLKNSPLLQTTGAKHEVSLFADVDKIGRHLSDLDFLARKGFLDNKDLAWAKKAVEILRQIKEDHEIESVSFELFDDAKDSSEFPVAVEDSKIKPLEGQTITQKSTDFVKLQMSLCIGAEKMIQKGEDTYMKYFGKILEVLDGRNISEFHFNDVEQSEFWQLLGKTAESLFLKLNSNPIFGKAIVDIGSLTKNIVLAEGYIADLELLVVRHLLDNKDIAVFKKRKKQLSDVKTKYQIE